VYHPDPNAFAEICYSLPDGKIWRAVVFKHLDGWELRFGRTTGSADTFMPAGTFQNPKALVKFIKAKIEERVGDVTTKPIYDTLHKLKNRSAQSVVPDCYSPVTHNDEYLAGRGLPECDGCPFRTNCTEPSAQPVVIPEEECAETEEVFRHRLAQKMKERFPESASVSVKEAAAKKTHDSVTVNGVRLKNGVPPVEELDINIPAASVVPMAVDPVEPAEGAVWFNFTTNDFKTYKDGRIVILAVPPRLVK
jgi:hypothetical protein